MITARVKIDLSGLRKFRKIVNRDLRAGGTGPIRDALKQWAARYRGFVQRRFVRFSRGGGDWPPLKRKRKRGKLAAAAILRDTGTMFVALDPVFQGKPGQLEKSIPFGIRVGYGGPSRHPKAPMTVADLARMHDQGLGAVPERKIIVEPDDRTLSSMAGDMERALKRLADDTIGS